MMGRAHALTGVLAAAGTAYTFGVDVGTFVFLCTTLPGTAILNDIDHPDSTVSSTYGPITGVLARVLDHRKQTHSVPGILAFGIGVHLAAVHREYMISKVVLFIVLVLIYAAAIRLFHIKGWLDDLAPIPFAAAVTFGESWLHDLGVPAYPFKLLPYMIVLGMLVHVVGDIVTKQPIPIMWPLSSKGTALGLFKAGGTVETVLTWVLIIPATLTFATLWIMKYVIV